MLAGLMMGDFQLSLTALVQRAERLTDLRQHFPQEVETDQAGGYYTMRPGVGLVDD
jgi:hypothetical protein